MLKKTDALPLVEECEGFREVIPCVNCDAVMVFKEFLVMRERLTYKYQCSACKGELQICSSEKVELAPEDRAAHVLTSDELILYQMDALREAITSIIKKKE